MSRWEGQLGEGALHTDWGQRVFGRSSGGKGQYRQSGVSESLGGTGGVGRGSLDTEWGK